MCRTMRQCCAGYVLAMNKTGKDLDALDASELAPLIEAAAKKLQETRQAQAA